MAPLYSLAVTLECVPESNVFSCCQCFALLQTTTNLYNLMIPTLIRIMLFIRVTLFIIAEIQIT